MTTVVPRRQLYLTALSILLIVLLLLVSKKVLIVLMNQYYQCVQLTNFNTNL